MRVRVWPIKRYGYRAELSITLSIPEFQFFLGEGLEESARQGKPGGLKSTQPLLPDWVNCFQSCNRSLFAARGDDHGLPLLGPLQELRQIRLGFKNGRCDHGLLQLLT